MPEAIAPVVATATTDTDLGKAPAPKPVDNRNISSSDKQLDGVLSELFQKHGGSKEEFKSFGEIADDVMDKSKPEAKIEPPKPKIVPPQKAPEAEAAEEAPKPTVKEKLKVGDQVYELDGDALKRFAQKGIYYEKKGVEIANYDKQLQTREAQVSQQEAREQAFIEALDKDPGSVLEYLFGEAAFDKIKPWATKRVQKLQEYEQNPHLQEIERERSGRLAAEQELTRRNQTDQASQEQQEVDQHLQSYQKTITDALDMVGMPTGEDVSFLAADMAGHMKRALDRKVDVTPQQLAEMVKQDNSVRVKMQVGSISMKIEEAKKAGDQNAVAKYGQSLVEMLGEPVMYAIAKYHLSRMHSSQPNTPRTILEAPRVPVQKEEPKKGYMKWEEWETKRKERAAAIDRGENVPDW